MTRFLAFFGTLALDMAAGVRRGVEESDRHVLLLVRSLIWLVRPPFRFREIVRQFDFVGVQSVPLICITGAFTGMVLALQGDFALRKFGGESLVGAGVALSLTRELGPVIGALMVVARAGSAFAAEIGTMRNTEQIDALASMAVDPIQYLVVPRILAATISLPLLAILFEFSGMIGAYVIATKHIGIDAGAFMAGVREWVWTEDITHGLIKSVVFGLILSLVSCCKGFFVTGGARGVGLATTRAVVLSSLLILASDYMMTELMFQPSS